MKKASFLAAFAAVILMPASALAQFGFDSPPEPDPPAWEQFKLNPNTRVKLDFRNASVDAILQTLTQASGVTIIKDPSLNSAVTLQSPKPQTLKDAFAMFNTALSLRNFDLKKEGNFLVIRPHAVRMPGGFGGGFGGPGGGRGAAQTALKVYLIKYASASQVARVINEVFAPAAPTPTAGGAGGFGGGNPFAFGGRGQRAAGAQGAATTANAVTVKASSDDFSNSVIVNAPSRQQDDIKKIIDQIDKQTEQPQQSRVFPLRYAVATDVANVVQSVLVSNTPRGRGNSTSQPQNNPFPFGGGRFGGGGLANQTANGTVTPDQRTNSLIVTAIPDNLDIVSKVITQLDKPVKFENGAYVITLKNARADSVAQILNAAFASTNGANSSLLNNLTSSANRTTTSTGSTANLANSQPSSLTGRAARISAPGANTTGTVTGVADENADPNQPIQVAQNFGGGGFGGGGFGGGGGFQRPGGGQSNGTTSTVVLGQDSSGQVTPIRSLAGQIITIPDVSTNSVIIVSPPEDRAIVEKILETLDRIPQQVMIETLIVEANLDAATKLGVEWNFTAGGGKSTVSSAFGNQANTTQPQGLNYVLKGATYGAFIDALKTDTRFEVLSTPRIFTSNNTTAQINISQSLPYVTSSRTDTNGNLTYTYAFLDVGIVLTVTPRITANGYVTMDVTQTANDFVSYTSFNAPIVNQREAQTTVSVKDGETAVLGGIIKTSLSSTVNKIPLLGDLPLFGHLFRSTTKDKQKTELLVFLTPRVVRDEKEAEALRERSEKQLAPGTLDILKKSNVINDISKMPTPGNKPDTDKKPNTDKKATPDKPLDPDKQQVQG